MVDVSAYHGIESHPATFIINPVVVELARVNRTDDVADVLIVQFEKHHQCMPIFMLVILKRNPQVVVLSVVGKDKHTHLGVWHGMSATWGILQAHHALMIVGCRINKMPHKHLHRSVLYVSFHAHLFIRKRKEQRYLAIQDLVDTVYNFLIFHIFFGLKGCSIN